MFVRCIRGLGDVAQAFSAARREITVAPTEYEADFAALKLMQQVLLHVESVAAVAALSDGGSHLASAWVLLRSAFETGVTALWLAKDDDWKERESRWLGWVVTWEEHYRKLASDLVNINREGSLQFSEFSSHLKGRREAIAGLLPKDSRIKRPSLLEMMREVGVEDNKYIVYRIGSQVTHAGAGLDEFVVRQVGDYVSFVGAVSPTKWKEPLQLASWSITGPGVVVLARAGVSQAACDRIVDAHDRLLQLTGGLDGDG